jgi:protease-4
MKSVLLLLAMICVTAVSPSPSRAQTATEDSADAPATRPSAKSATTARSTTGPAITPRELIERMKARARASRLSSTQPADGSAESKESATTRPAVASKSPATSASARIATTKSKYPTPAELLAKMKQTKAKRDATPKVAHFDLSRTISEKPRDFAFWGNEDTQTLNSILDRLRQAQGDKSVHAILVTLGDESPSFAQAQEIRDALQKLTDSGKETFVYADSFDTAGYTLASGASHICMLEGGDIMIPGVGMQAMFARGLLDKIGVQADYIQIGEYKGADEELTRTEASEELRGEMNKLTQSLYDEIVDGIADHRNISRAEVKRLIDQAIIRGTQAKERGLVDHLIDQDGLRALVKDEINQKEMEVVPHYGVAPREEPDFSNPFAIFQMMSRKAQPTTKPSIALVYADGMIVDGNGGEGMFGNAVGAEDFRKAMRTATRDSSIKAIVIRIDSPGGSALASEVMWQAARRAAKDKPLIVSIGGMAASGGYYLASAGDTIFADPGGIVGSIGVVGGKFVIKDLLEKVGVTTESFSKGRNAELFTMTEPFNDRQRKLLTTWMRQTYDQFIDRVETGRGDKIKDIDQVARGRIFLARQAKSLGMVDEIGGTTDAIAYAANKVKLKQGEYELRILPAPRTLADYFGFQGPEAGNPLQPQITIAPDSILRVLSPEISRLLMRQIQSLQLLQSRPVMLVMPVHVEIR